LLDEEAALETIRRCCSCFNRDCYGRKNHVNADARHKLIRQYDVTNASVHDSLKFDGLLNQANTSSDVYADSAYADHCGNGNDEACNI
jgi:hypothetical protein